MKPRRKQRVAAFLRNEIATIIQLDLRDPRIGLVSVTRVEPTEDLKEAKVFVSILGTPADQRKGLRGLSAARGFIQQQLSDRHTWRHTPNLSFELDDSAQKNIEMEALLRLAREGATADEASRAEAGSVGDSDSVSSSIEAPRDVARDEESES